MVSKFLFLDDERFPEEVDWLKLPSVDHWSIVRSYDEFIVWITINGLPAFVTFDHDLAAEHYPFSDLSKIPFQNGFIPYDKYREKTGNCAARWLVSYCLRNKKDLPSYQIHTMNPIGKINISKTLEAFHTPEKNV